MESLGDWSWPGTAAAEVLPPPWVPAFPPRREPLAAVPAAGTWAPERVRARRLAAGALLSALAAASVAIAIKGPLDLERLAGLRAAPATAAAEFAPGVRVDAVRRAPPPTPRWVSTDEAGGIVEKASFASAALHAEGSFYMYLPPGFTGAPAPRYPVLYLLHGNDQPATAFLQIGVPRELDRLISSHQIPALIAVMIQGGRGANNWRNDGSLHYESYVLEVQELIDRMLPTIATRGARAIAGDSMGGYGAMNVALGNPYRFGVVESWLGFFNGLGGELHADRPVISRLGLHAFVYGAESDHIANPAEDPPFAAALRTDGARADSAIYPGEHSLETVEAHLGSMLAFAGRSLQLPPVSETPVGGG